MSKELPWPDLDRQVEPLQDQRATDERVNRWARQLESDERVISALRGTGDGGVAERGLGPHGVRAAAAAAARAARSENDFVKIVWQQLQGSHTVGSSRDAQLFIDTAVNEYVRLYRPRDPDWALRVGSGMAEEYRRAQLLGRRRRVGEIVGQIQGSELMQQRMIRQDRVNALAAETGLSHDFIEDFLAAYEAQRAMRIPLVIQPAAVPFLAHSPTAVLGDAYVKPLLPVLRILMQVAKDLLPMVGAVEAITGRDLLTGRELELWERLLGAAADLVPLARGGTAAVRLGRAVRAGVRAVHKGSEMAAGWAVAALRLQVPPDVMLRSIGQLSQVHLAHATQLMRRLRAARLSKNAVKLDAADRQLLQQLQRTALITPPRAAGQTAQTAGRGAAASRAAAAARPLARRFVLSQPQMAVTGLLLGRIMDASRAPVRAGLKASDDAAEDLVQRIRAHWEAALPKSGLNAEQTAQRIFKRLQSVRPRNPNDWVRTKFFDLWRRRAMRRVNNDAALRRDLQERAGIILGRPGSTNSMYLRTQVADGSTSSTVLDIDHGVIKHEHAVAAALKPPGDYRQLISTVVTSNLQIVTARENRQVLEALRKALAAMGDEVPAGSSAVQELIRRGY